MKQHVYGAPHLAGVLRSLEIAYGISSADFYRAHVEDDEAVIGRVLKGSHRQAWAGFYDEWCRLGCPPGHDLA